MNQFVVQFDQSQFTEGDNWVRLYCIGGPQHWNDKTIMMLENSEYTLFCVTINGDKAKIRGGLKNIENTKEQKNIFPYTIYFNVLPTFSRCSQIKD